MPTLGGGENDQETLWRYFLPLAMRFDLRRHNCTATWKITRTSIELESADCDRDPLDADYQYYDNCQLNLPLEDTYQRRCFCRCVPSNHRSA